MPAHLRAEELLSVGRVGVGKEQIVAGKFLSLWDKVFQELWHSAVSGEGKTEERKEFSNRRPQRSIAATTEGDRIGVSAYGRVGENDAVKPRSPERNPRENARSSTTVDQRSQRIDIRNGPPSDRHSLFAGCGAEVSLHNTDLKPSEGHCA
jgi:hypothetical protein